MKIDFRLLEIPFKVSFKHNSASRKVTSTIWVEISRGEFVGIGEGCPRSYVTGESEESCMAFISARRESLMKVEDYQSLLVWREGNILDIESNPAAWCAIELAFLDLFAQETNQSINELIGEMYIPHTLEYSAVLGDSAPGVWEKLCDWHLENEMSNFKLKLNGDVRLDSERITYIRNKNSQAEIRVDANNMWNNQTEAVSYLNQLPKEINGVEEPLTCPNWDGINSLSAELAYPIILDEHVFRLSDLKEVKYPENTIVNLRVSKCGGLINSIEMGKRAIELGMRVIVGAQVGETSALTKAGFLLSSALLHEIIAHEGGYGMLLLESDPFREYYQLGKKGQIIFS
jgi:L-alanine-DL-glutamate epimerase-like enolase superfamily enzyme